MKKFFTLCSVVALSFFGTSFPAFAADGPFELEYNFDNAADFPDGAVLPQGWAGDDSGFTRREAADFGFTAPSGDFVLGKARTNATEVLYLPMMQLKGGEPCTIEFKYIAPASMYVWSTGVKVKAGTAQNAESQTIEVGEVTANVYNSWEKQTFTFTPETDGEYCISLNLTKGHVGTANGSGVAFDDIFVTGTGGTSGDKPVDPDPEPGDEGYTPEPFEIEVNFDDDALYAAGNNVPEGWVESEINLTRRPAEDFGFTAVSGDYILGKARPAGKESIYSPMIRLKGGEPCTIEFSFIAPSDIYIYSTGVKVKAGTAQNAESQTIEVGEVKADVHNSWEKQTFTFTPEQSGEYCISFNIFNGMMGCARNGGAAMDDIFISGTRLVETGSDPDPELIPNEDNLADCIELPYFETFSDPNHYSGDYLPTGWTSTGTTAWRTANLGKLLYAVEGDYYMVTPPSGSERDENAYTPFFNLEAGKTYEISFHSMIEGAWDEDGELTLVPSITFTAGTEQEAEFQQALLKIENQHTAWEQHKLTFTPKHSGPYCFSFQLTGPASSGHVAIDYLTITAEGLVARTEPRFSPNALFDLFTGSLMVFKDEPVEIINTTAYGVSYEWTIKKDDVEIATSTEVNPSFVFPSSGEYVITLASTNPRGTRSTSKTYDVLVIDETQNSDIAFHLMNEKEDKIVEKGNIPTFTTDTEADFITGYNHYYNRFAQRFDLPAGKDVWVKQITVYVTDRRYRNMTATLADDRVKPFLLTIYGSDSEGNLDSEKILGQLETTVGAALGSSGIGGWGGENISIELPAPAKVSGTIYVAMEFDESMTIDAEDANLGRSYMATAVIKHAHGRTGLYATPRTVAEAQTQAQTQTQKLESGKWYPIEAFESGMKGYSAYWNLWASPKSPVVGGVANIPAATLFAARINGDMLTVNGTVAGEAVRVYSVNGQLVATGMADSDTLDLNVGHLAPGLYIVKAKAGSVKTLK